MATSMQGIAVTAGTEVIDVADVADVAVRSVGAGSVGAGPVGAGSVAGRTLVGSHGRPAITIVGSAVRIGFGSAAVRLVATVDPRANDA